MGYAFHVPAECLLYAKREKCGLTYFAFRGISMDLHSCHTTANFFDFIISMKEIRLINFYLQ